MANTALNVSVGKPQTAGAIYVAPLGTDVPKTVSAALSDAFACLGYVSEDGLTNSNSPESDEILAWGGEEVLTAQTGKDDSFQFTLIESKNIDVLKAVYGESNVTGSESSGIKIWANTKEYDDCVWVFDIILRESIPKRIVVPIGKVTELGDIAYTDENAIGYDTTVACTADEEGNTHYEYTRSKGWVAVYVNILVFFSDAEASGDTVTITGEAEVNDETLILTN